MKWYTLSFEVAEKKMIYNIYYRRPYHFHRNSGGPFTIQPNDDNLVEDSSLSSFFSISFYTFVSFDIQFPFCIGIHLLLGMIYCADVSVSNNTILL